MPTKEAAMRSQLSKIVVVVLVTSALLLTSEAKKSVKMRNKPLKGELDFWCPTCLSVKICSGCPSSKQVDLLDKVRIRYLNSSSSSSSI